MVAISVHHLNGVVPFQSIPPAFLRTLREKEPIARAGDSIVLFRY